MFSARLIIIFVYLVSLFVFKRIIYYFTINPHDLFFNYWNDKESEKDLYDYVIVGCGSAGAIVANRLAEDSSAKILILEAGVDAISLNDIPSIGLLLQDTHLDWQHVSAAQNASCFALNNNSSRWPMGKIVGGTSFLNNMVYVRGHHSDFAEWFEEKKGYDYSDVLYYFNKLENRNLEDNLEKPIFVNDLSYASTLQKVLSKAARSLGYTIHEDITNCQQGFGKPKATLNNGERWTSAHYLKRKFKPNIKLKTNAIVTKVILKDNFEACGVEYSYKQENYYARAKRAVILSSGVIGTPKLLMLSGIGPKNHLKELKINPIIDLPVGNNLQDHITTGFDLVLLNQTLDIGIEEMLSPFSAFDYFWNRRGPWTTGGCDLIGFFNRNSLKDAKTKNFDRRPDLQLMVMPLGITEDMGFHLRNLIGISDFTWQNYFAKLNNTKTVTLLPILLHPKSRGTVRLRNNDPFSRPIIDPQYLSEKEDFDVLIKGIDLVKKLIETEVMQKLGAKLNEIVFPGCESYTFDTTPYWECYIKHLTITSYHPVGTCKMGSIHDRTTVVDFDFRVRGTNKLYIVDGSIMPSLTSGNIIGPIYMLAEMAADTIKKNYYLSYTMCHAKDIFVKKIMC